MKSNPSGYRWTVLAVSYMCQFSFSLVFQSIPPVLRLVISELEITHAQAGLLVSLFALPGVFVAIPSGIVSDHSGVKKVGVASLFLMVAGTLIVGVSKSFLLMAVGRTVSGIGGMILATVLPQLLSHWFLHEELGLGLGIFNTAMPLGTIISFNVLGTIGANLGWQLSMLFTSVVSFSALIVFLLLFRQPQGKRSEASGDLLSEVLNVGKPVWLVGLAWMWFNAALISFLTFAQDFFVTQGLETGSARLLSSTIMMGPLLVSPFVGYLASKLEKERVFVIVAGPVLASLILIVSTYPSMVIIPVLIGVSGAFVGPPIFSLLAKIAKPHHLGLAFGIFTTCLNAGVLAGPYLTGLAKDLTGDYTLSLHLMSLFAILQTSTILLLYIFEVKCKQ